MIPREGAIVRHSITVGASQETAFATFTSGHDRWWPRDFHIGGAELQEAVLEPREEGRWYERGVDGSECEWGKVLVWEPPSRIVLAWQVTGEWAYDRDLLTEVEVRFVAEGPDRTRVELEHRGLDAYGDAMEQMRGQFDSGWPAFWPGLRRPRSRPEMGYDVAVYLHLLSVFVLIGGITVFGVCYAQIRAAGSLSEATPWARLADRTGWVFPVAILGLLASGAYLTSDRWTWSTPWILASIAGVILLMLQGPLIAAPRSAALKHALDAGGQSGALDPRVGQLARDRALWVALLANPGIVLGITWDMTVKPGGPAAAAAIVVGYLVGVAAALRLTRQAAPSA